MKVGFSLNGSVRLEENSKQLIPHLYRILRPEFTDLDKLWIIIFAFLPQFYIHSWMFKIWASWVEPSRFESVLLSVIFDMSQLVYRQQLEKQCWVKPINFSIFHELANLGFSPYLLWIWPFCCKTYKKFKSGCFASYPMFLTQSAWSITEPHRHFSQVWTHPSRVGSIGSFRLDILNNPVCWAELAQSGIYGPYYEPYLWERKWYDFSQITDFQVSAALRAHKTIWLMFFFFYLSWQVVPETLRWAEPSRAEPAFFG